MNRVIICFGFLGAVASANAGILNLSEDPAAGSNVHWMLYGNQESTFAGRLQWTFQSQNYKGFCAEAATMYVDNMDYTLLDTSFLPPVFPNAHQNEIAYLVNKYTLINNDLTSGTALQLAIWDELYDAQPGDVTNTSQNFYVISTDVLDFNTTTSLANSYLNEAFLNAGASDVALYFTPTESVNQSFVAPVPEPATLAALGAGLLCLRRRKKSA